MPSTINLLSISDYETCYWNNNMLNLKLSNLDDFCRIVAYAIYQKCGLQIR